jgi:hypothetical protein
MGGRHSDERVAISLRWIYASVSEELPRSSLFGSSPMLTLPACQQRQRYCRIGEDAIEILTGLRYSGATIDTAQHRFGGSRVAAEDPPQVPQAGCPARRSPAAAGGQDRWRKPS